VFADLVHKITVAVSWFGPQNQVGYGLSVMPQNRWEDEDGVGHALISSSLLHLEASCARVSESILKTGGGAARMVNLASSQRSSGDEVEVGWVDAMGCIRLFYPQLCHFPSLSIRAVKSLVFL
jgi:hypothetical protein